MSDTPLLDLPLLDAAQAQKHVTHNEALLRLDAACQLAVASRALAAPPADPEDGARYLVADGASGGWLGQAGDIACFTAMAWRFLTPRAGWRLWVADEATLLLFDGTRWFDLRAVESLGGLAHVGVNATADGWNRLIVRGPGVLLTHEAGDHRLTINKEAAGNTGTLLFQSGYGGRAEMGLAGDDDFHLKVSADGTSWAEALVIDAASGAVRFPAGTALAQASAALAADVPLSAADSFVDGPTLALAAGTWLVWFQATYVSSAAVAATVTARLSDGATHYAGQAASHAAASSQALGFSLMAAVTLPAGATLRGQMAATAAAGSMAAAMVGTPACLIAALRVA